jgi:hypothetical protein
MTRLDRLVLNLASRLLTDLTRRRLLITMRLAQGQPVPEPEITAVGWPLEEWIP